MGDRRQVSPIPLSKKQFQYKFCSPDVEFCAYTVAHPMEATMHLRIQMRKGRAVDALKRGLEDLVSLSDHVLEQFSREKQEFDAMFV
jgi:DNA-directed RNA polymerase I and III subunit RPAC2